MDAGKILSQVEITAVVIRADGRKEPLGQVAYWHRSFLRRVWHILFTKFCTILKGAYHGHESR